MSLKRDIEAIYVLEPWYSKMRQELKDEGWVQDNMFWERCKRTLDKLTERVLHKLGQDMSLYIWVRGFDLQRRWDQVDRADLAASVGLFLIEGDRIGLRDIPIGVASQDLPAEINKYYREFPWWVVDPRVDKKLLSVLDSIVLNPKGKYEVRGLGSRRLIKDLIGAWKKEERARLRLAVFPPRGSSVNLVRRFQPKDEWHYEGNLRFAKAIDRMSSSLGGGVPERILAINVALGTMHTDMQPEMLYQLGMDYDILARWSRMGLRSKATAKQYLEHAVPQAVDMLLEGYTRGEAVASLYRTRQ